MDQLSQVIRMLGALILASLTALASFGLLLAAAWALVGPRADLKLAAALLCAGFAVSTGGLVTGRVLPSQGPAAPALFGLILGWTSFAYILGSDPRVIVFSAASVLLSVIGGLMLWPLRKGPVTAGLNASGL